MLISLTVGKVDAGVAVLLTEDKRLIEFPSILLPPSITSGSIVDIQVSQNHQAESQSQSNFNSLQSRILHTYGIRSPQPPVLRLRGATQTSLVLEWDPIQLATSSLRSLSLYRNGSKAGSIPRPVEMTSTKISGLAVDTEYTFHLLLRTSGGTHISNILSVRTHKMTDLSGITVTAGSLPEQLRESLGRAVERIGGRVVDSVRIDTTHFVCTEGRGRDWELAVEMSIPVVRPEWVEGCEREGKIVGVRDYYLDANPKNRQVGTNPAISGGGGGVSGAGSATSSQAASTTSAARAGMSSPPNIPSRGPGTRNLDSTSGDGRNGPGPGPATMVPPTPPQKIENPATPSQAVSAAADEAEDEDEAPDEDVRSASSAQHPATSGFHSADDEELATPPSSKSHTSNPLPILSGKGKLQDGDTEEEGGEGKELEDVAL